MILEDLIREKLKDLVFLELKNSTKIKDILLNEGFPLPINLNTLIGGIKNDEFNEEININRINEGIVFLLGIDPDFKYSNQYLDIIKKTTNDIKNYLIYLSELSIKNNDLISSYIYLRNYELYLDFDYELDFMINNLLENIYNKYLNDLEDSENILKDIINTYEKLAYEYKYSLSFYRLGFINKAINNYLKSKIYFEKFLQENSINLELKDEVREELKEIEDYSNIESAETLLNYGKSEEAYHLLKKVSTLYPNKSYLYYLLSLSETKLGLLDIALEHIDKALTYEETEMYYNQKALILINLSQSEKAVLVYLEGIEFKNDSYLLNYNLGILLYNLGKKESFIYLKKAYQLNPDEKLLSLINTEKAD